MPMSPTTKAATDATSEVRQQQDQEIPTSDTVSDATWAPEDDADNLLYWQFPQEDDAAHDEEDSNTNVAAPQDAVAQDESVSDILETPNDYGVNGDDDSDNGISAHEVGTNRDDSYAVVGGETPEDPVPLQYNDAGDSIQPDSSETVPPVVTNDVGSNNEPPFEDEHVGKHQEDSPELPA